MNLYEEKFLRNKLTRHQQERIKRTKFAIVGLGGTGGFILENLLRMGAENLIVFDHDCFELSNFNRQSLATEEFLDMPKVHAAIARAKAINNNVKISSFSRFDENTDVDATILLDGTDNIKSKLVMAQKARKKRIPYVFCSAQASRGIVSIFVRYKFEKAFQLPKDLVVMEIPLRQSGTEHRSRLDETELSHYRSCSSILCPAASLAGSLAASQAINFLLKKPYVSAPNALFFDLDKKEIFWRGKLG